MPETTPKTKADPEGCAASNCSVFEIRTLRDIFELPTFEQMETCLEELADSMKMARAAADLMAELVAAQFGNPVGKVVEWPDVLEWKDDGKGEVVAVFKDGDKTLLEVTSRQNAQADTSP